MVVFGIFGGKKSSGDVNIEHVLNELSVRDGKVIERDDVKYVKSISLDSEAKNMDKVLRELRKGNVVILNVTEVSHNKLLLRDIVKELREASVGMDGDIARISQEKILILPGGMKVSHSEQGS
ncbi:MAG: DUF552 domain-containing protein [Candidatus Altiarchaeales archaeon]|nr:DUF552 domain-containing protein [Candidatus Altiarchaeales archaeon]